EIDVPAAFDMDGHYDLRIVTVDGAVFAARVDAVDIKAARDPIISSPGRWTHLRTAFPLFQFENYVSDEYTPGQSRRLEAQLILHPPDEQPFLVTQKWAFSEPTRTSLSPSRAQRSGEYRFLVNYVEGHKMGAVSVAREAMTVLPIFLD